MMTSQPLYTEINCIPCYKLYWTCSVFWRDRPIEELFWLEALKPLTEKNGVRILEYRLMDNSISQFLLSTRPNLSPSEIIRYVKGPLQMLIRKQNPKAFKHNYSIQSVGEPRHDVVQEYLDSQLQHHKMADPDVQAMLANYQIDCPDVDLTRIRSSARGRFMHNLHLVLVNAERYREVREERLHMIREMIVKISSKKQLWLSRASVLADHIHLTLGCDVTDSPQQVVLTFMNNLAFAFGQVPVFEYSYYVGTFGKYDLGAVRQALHKKRSQSSLRGGKPRGGGKIGRS